MSGPRYVLVPSPFGQLAICWQETAAGPRVQHVLLPRAGTQTADLAQASGGGGPGSVPAISELGERMAAFLSGEDVHLRLDLLALERCSAFQQRVLRAEYAIPRGRVSTYGRIARYLSLPGGARAVGMALARNPFPIVIPCHRAIAADGRIGGYQGGLAMKQALLEMEGVRFSPQGRVLVGHYYYGT